MDYKSFPIQDIINSGNVENTLNKILEMQKTNNKNIKFIDVPVMTPAHIVDEMLDTLPIEIWNYNTRFLNIACKDAIFLVKIFQRLMKIESTLFKDDTEKAWHILENQLYAVCIDETVGKLISTLIYGVSGLDVSHITWFKTSKDLQKLNNDALKQYVYNRFRETGNIGKKETLKYMQFDVVIGNPPYNKGMDLDFVNMGFELSNKYTCMITPAKWQTAEADQKIASKMSYGEFRKQLVPHMKIVCFYPCCKDAFDILQVDGITYYLLDKNKSYEKCIVKNVCKNIKEFDNSIEERSINNRQSLLNIGNEIVDYLGEYRRFNIQYTYNRKKYQVWTNTQTPGGNLSTVVAPRKTLFIGESIIEEDFGLNFEHSNAEICSFTSDNKDECISFISWLNCKFTRFFTAINQSKLTGIITNDCFRFVPAPPSGKFDHTYTDEELYKAFNLPQKYIDVIEAVIKERK